MKRFAALTAAIVSTAALGVSAALPTVASATAMTEGASTYTSNGSEISGWNWVRETGNYATWNFDADSLDEARSKTVYLNVNALVTNGTNGGSGYSADSVKFLVTCGSKSYKSKVKLSNPYRPVDSQNSNGVGYSAYGASSSPLKFKSFTACDEITVRVAYPFLSGRHIAFKKESVVLGYSK